MTRRELDKIGVNNLDEPQLEEDPFAEENLVDPDTNLNNETVELQDPQELTDDKKAENPDFKSQKSVLIKSDNLRGTEI